MPPKPKETAPVIEERVEPKPDTGKLHRNILLGVISFILIMVLTLFLLIPSPEQAAQRAREATARAAGPELPTQFHGTDETLAEAERLADMREMELDVFSISESHGTEPTTTTYRFRFALLYDRRSEAAFTREYESRKAQIQAAILVILREASDRERNDPQLEAIRPRILRQVNTIMGDQGLVQRVILTEWSREVM